ncbi:DUF2797 domain-containing protein [Kribbella sandramycini]
MLTDGARLSGLVWNDGVPQFEWSTPDGSQRSPIRLGAQLAMTVGPGRECLGIFRHGRRLGCPTAVALPAHAHGPLCPDCQTLDRSNSIAADTRMDDPREFAVYLAHHGSRLKVGITAVDRGPARLLEQGALSSTVLSTGSLAAARRVERLFSSAFGTTDRVNSPVKRAARLAPPSAAERAAELQALAEQTVDLDWPDGQERRPTEVTDHTPTYGLASTGVQPLQALAPLDSYGVVSGRLSCHIGRDLYLDTPEGLTLVDTQLLAGWELVMLDPAAVFTAATTPIAVPVPEVQQDALF